MENLIPEARWRRAYRDIMDFERTIADDDHLIIKLFLHIGKEEQKLRLEKRSRKPSKAWRVTSKDWEQNQSYEEWAEAFEEMFERTDTEWGPWTVIPATNRRYRHYKIYETILDALEERLGIAPPEPSFTGVPGDESDRIPTEAPEISPKPTAPEPPADAGETDAPAEGKETASQAGKISTESTQA